MPLCVYGMVQENADYSLVSEGSDSRGIQSGDDVRGTDLRLDVARVVGAYILI